MNILPLKVYFVEFRVGKPFILCVTMTPGHPNQPANQAGQQRNHFETDNFITGGERWIGLGRRGEGGVEWVSKKGERGKVSEREVGRFLEALLNHSLNNLRFRASVTQFFRTQKDTLVFTYFI